jgi:hypothetical protein
VTGAEADAVGLTQREVIMEIRDDVKELKVVVDVIARDQALGVERRANMQRSADAIFGRLDQHDHELDEFRRWRDRADGALILAKWALGASLISLIAVGIQLAASFAKSINPALP